ncbi:MAG: hypothetical protein JWM10_2456 [Myxococcaceae bacterium]|nr:hypothetical protein [Myxococcaceae bacterium]
MDGATDDDGPEERTVNPQVEVEMLDFKHFHESFHDLEPLPQDFHRSSVEATILRP